MPQFKFFPSFLCHTAVFGALFFLPIFPASVTAAQKFDPKKVSKTAEVSFTGPAVMAIVSLDEQTVSLFDEKGATLKSRISSGQSSYETPVGIYSVLQKEQEHYSNLYDDAAMPFMQRITWSGLSLHAGELPGYPASHGCVRLPYPFAQKIFNQTRLGMRVIVARDTVLPKPLEHPALFQPKAQDMALNAKGLSSFFLGTSEADFLNEKILQLLPEVQRWPGRQAQQDSLIREAFRIDRQSQEVGAQLEGPKRTVEELTKARNDVKTKLQSVELLKKKVDKELLRATVQFSRTKKPKEMTLASEARWAIMEQQDSLLSDLSRLKAELEIADINLQRETDVLKKYESQYEEALRHANDAKLRMLPISVLVSLKTQRIYVRQGFEQILESEIKIENPDQPIGTQIYTALGYDQGGEHVLWTSVSLKSPELTFAYISNSYEEDHQWISDNPARVSEYEDSAGALERIKIPGPIRERISEYVWPGSSLIITDEEPHKETGKATEFVVLISGEPQGGIIKRGPTDPYAAYYWDSFFNWSDAADRRRYERERRRFEREQRRQRSYYGWD